MLGVSPVTMDDLTSGYNIATNINPRLSPNNLGLLSDNLGLLNDMILQ